MRIRPFPLAIVVAGIVALGAPAFVNAQARQYEANFVSSAPVIDGVLTDGEWDAAADGGGDWENLSTDRIEDDENNRFRVLWDQQGLYVLGESDYDFWGDDISGQDPAPSDFAGDFFGVFLDPNTLGEENGQLDTEVDNYQISFNIYADARSCGGDLVAGTADDCTQPPAPPLEPLAVDGTNVTGLTFGTLSAAHADGLFNNAAEWGHLRASHISYTAGDDGAVIELFMPWEEFDALAVTSSVDEETMEPNGVETGLHHPFAPSNDDVWFFNVNRQSTEPSNMFPQWNWTSSCCFASHGIAGAEGHGELIFVGAPDAPSFLPADFDESGTVDFADFLVLSEAFGSAVDPAGTNPDIDGSGTVDFADFLVLSESFGQTSAAAAAVPEPTAMSLLMLGTMMLGLVRRRRN